MPVPVIQAVHEHYLKKLPSVGMKPQIVSANGLVIYMVIWRN